MLSVCTCHTFRKCAVVWFKFLGKPLNKWFLFTFCFISYAFNYSFPALWGKRCSFYFRKRKNCERTCDTSFLNNSNKETQSDWISAQQRWVRLIKASETLSSNTLTALVEILMAGKTKRRTSPHKKLHNLVYFRFCSFQRLFFVQAAGVFNDRNTL